MAANKRAAKRATPDAPAATRPWATLPPWLSEAGAALQRRERSGRLPHALLLRGVPGVGKRLFARWFAQSVLCRDPGADGACGDCPACRQSKVGAHPDYRELVPEGAGIKVDAVRDLLVWQQMSTPGGRWRVALLDGADTMNRNAANALLKTLEEPADGALLLLVADQAARLPATVRSRCQDIVLAVESVPVALQWIGTRLVEQGQADTEAQTLLNRSGHAPLAAISLASGEAQETLVRVHKAWLDLFLHRASVGRISDSLAELPVRQCLAVFLRLSALALRQRAGLSVGPDPAEQSVVSQVFDRLEDAQWFTIRDRVERLHRIDGPGFKTQAVLEGLLADIRLMLTDRTGA